MGFARRIAWGFAALFACAALAANPALAYTDVEIGEVFKAFDANGDGKVTSTEFALSKVQIIYRDIQTDPIQGVSFDQTRVSRRFFDSLDKDHSGKLSPIEILDGLRFEDIRSGTSDYFTLEDLRRFMISISG